MHIPAQLISIALQRRTARAAALKKGRRSLSARMPFSRRSGCIENDILKSRNFFVLRSIVLNLHILTQGIEQARNGQSFPSVITCQSFDGALFCCFSFVLAPTSPGELAVLFSLLSFSLLFHSLALLPTASRQREVQTRLVGSSDGFQTQSWSR